MLVVFEHERRHEGFVAMAALLALCASCAGFDHNATGGDASGRQTMLQGMNIEGTGGTPNAPIALDAGQRVNTTPTWREIGGRKSLGTTPLPCDVNAVLTTSCQGCHAADPGLLAPMALVSYEDMIAPAISDPTRPVHALAKLRTHATDTPMPPLGSRRLTAEELATLDAFIDGGARPGTDPSCRTAGVQDAGADADVVEPDDIGECYAFQAHDSATPGDKTPFQLPNGERYACFYFSVPWPENSQAVVLRSLDTPRTHHWQLYHVLESYTDGSVTRDAENCGFDLRDVLGVYSHSDEREQRMPPDVGLQLPPPTAEHGLLLEIHYYNPGETVGDNTGVEVCTAKTRRLHDATISVLGSGDFTIPPGQALDASGTCTPLTDQNINVFRSYPHMHARGVRMETWIERAAGKRDLLIDTPFDFNNQKMYDVAAQVYPGDSLTTTCHFFNDTDRSIATGFDANEEMCNQFLYYWPAGALASGVVDGVPVPCLL